jgi:hypothetical protein
MKTSENKLFITNEVRDYIKEVNDSQKKGNRVITEVMSIKLYMALCSFIENIYIYDNVDKKNTLKNYIINMVCSDNFDTKTKQSNLNIFIQSINPIKDVNGVLKKALTEIYTNIYKILEKDEKEQKDEINKILDNILNSSLDKNSDIEFHNIIKKELDKNTEDAKVYFEFFKIIECQDDLCQNPKELKNYKNKNARFSLIRDKNTNHVKLLEVFNGKRVKIFLTEQEILEIESYKNSYFKMIEEITKPYYDEIVKMITTSWGWVWGDDGIIQNTVDKGPEIIQSLYKAVKEIIKSFINISDDYKNNMLNYVSSYFNGKNDVIKNVKGPLSVIGDSSDSIKSFIKTTFIGTFAIGGLTALIRPDMLSSAVDTVMNTIKDYSYKIMNSVKNYTLNKVIGKAKNEEFENRYEEIKANTLDKMTKLTEDLSFNVENMFGIKTELENNNEKLKYLIKKLFELSDDIKITKYNQLLDYIKDKNIEPDEGLKNDKERFDSILNKLDKLDSKYIDGFITFVGDMNTFDIKAELQNDFDKLKLMADKVKNFTIEKKNEYLETFLNFFKEYNIIPGFIDENDKLQNVLTKIENSDDLVINNFVSNIEEKYPDIEIKNFLQPKYKLHNIKGKIILFSKEDKINILQNVRESYNIEPLLESDMDKIQNMLLQLKNKMEKNIKELIKITKERYDKIMTMTTDFLKNNFGVSTVFSNNIEKLKYVLNKLSKLSEKDKNDKIGDINDIASKSGILMIEESEESDKTNIIKFNNIIAELGEIEDDNIIQQILEKIKNIFGIDENMNEFDKIEYMFSETSTVIDEKKNVYFDQIMDFFKEKLKIEPENNEVSNFEKIKNILKQLKNKKITDYDEIKDMAKMFGLNFTNEYNDTISELTEAVKNKIYETADHYFVEFPYFTNNIDKLYDVLFKLRNINIESFNTFISEIGNMDLDNIADFCILRSNKIDKYIKYSIDALKIIPDKNYTNTIDIVNNINLQIHKKYFIDKKKDENMAETKVILKHLSEEINGISDKNNNNIEQFTSDSLIYAEIFPIYTADSLLDTKRYEIFGIDNYFLFVVKEKYKIEPNKYLTNNIDKIKDVIKKLKSVDLTSDGYNSSVNKNKYEFLKYFDEHFSIKADNPNTDIVTKCKNIKEKIIGADGFKDYKTWIDSKYKTYKIYNKEDIKRILFEKFKDCFENKEFDERLDLNITIDKIIDCDKNNKNFLLNIFDIGNINDFNDDNEEFIEALTKDNYTDIYLYYIKINYNIEPNVLNNDEKEILLEKAIADAPQILYETGKKYLEKGKDYLQELPSQLIDVGISKLKDMTLLGFTGFTKLFIGGMLIGGGHYKCYTVDNLKQNLLKILVKMTDSIEISDHIPSGELIEYDIDNDNELYVLKKELIMDYDEMERYKEEMQLKRMIDPTKMEFTERLKKTYLFKNSKNVNKHIWEEINKKSDVSPIKVLPKMPNLIIFPNNMHILNETLYTDINNYQIGGNNNIVENNKFTKMEIMDIKIQYSYEILSLLKKALRKLNENGIYLEDKTLKDIKYNINNLKNAEKDLSEYAVIIVNAGNMNNYNNKTEILNKETLQEYINKHNTLLQSSDRIAIKLNKAIVKLLTLI